MSDTALASTDGSGKRRYERLENLSLRCRGPSSITSEKPSNRSSLSYISKSIILGIGISISNIAERATAVLRTAVVVRAAAVVIAQW